MKLFIDGQTSHYRGRSTCRDHVSYLYVRMLWGKDLPVTVTELDVGWLAHTQ